MRFAILNEIVDKQHRDKEQNDLESVEGKVHVGVVRSHNPSKENHERDNEESDLHARTDGHTNGQVHFVCEFPVRLVTYADFFGVLEQHTFYGHSNSSSVLGSIADDGKENQTDESARKWPTGLRDRVDGIRHELSTDTNKCSGDA